MAEDIVTAFHNSADEEDIPVSLLIAIGYQETTGWNQFRTAPGTEGCTVMGNHACDYGLMQINWPTYRDSYTFTAVAGDYEYNIWAG